MWVAFKPFRNLLSMINPNHNYYAEMGTAGSGRARRFAAAAFGAYIGSKAADDDEEDARRSGAPIMPRFRPENESTPENEPIIVVMGPGGPGRETGGRYVGPIEAADSPRALPPGRDRAALAYGPGGRGGGRAEEFTVHVEPAADPVSALVGSLHRGSDGRVPVHVTETISGDDLGQGIPAGVRYGREDLPPAQVYRPGAPGGTAVRAESIRVAEAEVVDGREVYMIYRPGGGLEARDAVG
jgi:hypothetical protein